MLVAALAVKKGTSIHPASQPCWHVCLASACCQCSCSVEMDFLKTNAGAEKKVA
jgi:hypothetical protein